MDQKAEAIQVATEVHNLLLDQFLEAATTEIVRRVEARLVMLKVGTAEDPPLEETLSHMLESAAWFRQLIGKLLDDMDFRHEIEQVVHKYDFDEGIDAAIKRYDFTDAIEASVNEADFDHKIKDYIERRVTVAVEIKP